MIIANQDKNLFKTIKEISDIKILYDYEDYENVIDEKGYKCVKGINGSWRFKINNTTFAKYNSLAEKNYVRDKMIRAMKNNEIVFDFPENVNVSDVLEVAI